MMSYFLDVLARKKVMTRKAAERAISNERSSQIILQLDVFVIMNILVLDVGFLQLAQLQYLR